MIRALLTRSLERHAARVAVSHRGRSLTYADLDRESRRVATALARRGVGRGDRVGVLVELGLHYPIACVGILRAGAVVVPLDARAPVEDLRHLQSVTDFRCLVAAGAVGPSGVPHVDVNDLPTPRAALAPPETRPDDDAMFFFTSGTTGGPKGVIHTDESLAVMTERHADTSGVTSTAVVLATVPFFFFLGMMDLLLGPLARGAHVVIAQPFAPRDALETAARESVTLISAPPSIYMLLAAVEGAPALATLGRAHCGSATLAPDTRGRFHRRFGLHPSQSYGMTEVGRIASTGPIDSAPPPRSAGRPLIDLVIFADDGSPAAPGESGEIGVRSPGLCRPFYALAGGRREPLPMRSGYFLTGDVGRIAPDGSLILEGRKKSFIFGPGIKVDPHEVEEVLRRHPAVRDAVVLPAPGKAGYEAIRAVLVVSAGVTAGEIGAFCAAHLPPAKRPEIIELAPGIPRNAMGKVEIGKLSGQADPPR